MNDPQSRFFFLLLAFMQYLLHCNQCSISVIFFTLWHIVRQEHQIAAMKRKIKKRVKWSEFHKLLSKAQFRRYFRMDKNCFMQLCRDIEKSVGEDVFRSERFLRDGINHPKYYKLKQMQHAHLNSTGGFISGEVRLAITLRLLSGTFYQDLGLLFVISYSGIYHIFHYVLKK